MSVFGAGDGSFHAADAAADYEDLLPRGLLAHVVKGLVLVSALRVDGTVLDAVDLLVGEAVEAAHADLDLILFAQGTDYCTFSDANSQYWYLDDERNLVLGERTLLFEFPFELIAVNDEELTPVSSIPFEDGNRAYYSLTGIRINQPQEGVTIVRDSSGKTYKIYQKKTE